MHIPSSAGPAPPVLTLVSSDAGQPAVRPTTEAGTRDPLSAGAGTLTTAQQAVIDCCRAETHAEQHAHLTVRRGIIARPGAATIDDHNQALDRLTTARDARRQAVAELDQLEAARDNP